MRPKMTPKSKRETNSSANPTAQTAFYYHISSVGPRHTPWVTISAWASPRTGFSAIPEFGMILLERCSFLRRYEGRQSPLPFFSMMQHCAYGILDERCLRVDYSQLTGKRVLRLRRAPSPAPRLPDRIVATFKGRGSDARLSHRLPRPPLLLVTY